MVWNDLTMRLRALLSRRRVESELDEELSFHLAMEAEKNRARGLDCAESDAQARREFGGVTHFREECRDARGLTALENLVRDWQRRYPAVELSLRQELQGDLGPSVTLTAYRVVQEGLINALRHAQATRIAIDLNSSAKGMKITVRDDGVGLPAEWSRPGHFGLRGLADRLARLGGTLDVRSHAPSGVLLTAEIPLASPA